MGLPLNGESSTLNDSAAILVAVTMEQLALMGCMGGHGPLAAALLVSQVGGVTLRSLPFGTSLVFLMRPQVLGAMVCLIL